MGDRPAVLAIQSGSLLGDAITQLAAFRAIRLVWPEHRLILLATNKTVFSNVLAPVAATLFDEIVAGTPMPEDRAALVAYVDGLGGVAAMFDLRANRRSLISWGASGGGRAAIYCANVGGYLLRRGIPGLYERRPETNIRRIHRMVELAAGRTLAYDSSLPVTAENAARARVLLPDEGGPYLGIAPGAEGSVKGWPLRRHAELAVGAEQLGLRPVYLLGPQETPYIDAIAEASPRAVMIDARATGGDHDALLWLIHAAAGRLALCVANEGGLGHVAATQQIPIVTLSGPTNAARWRPVAERWWSVRSQDFGSDQVADILADAVLRLVSKIVGA